MYTLGPFALLEIGSPPAQIQLNVGRNGFIEVLNYTGFIFQVGLPNNGTVWHDAYGRAIYPVRDAMGPQTISIGIAVSPLIKNGFGQPNLLFQEATGFGDVIGRYYVNVYQEGEIEWYPPYTMTNPVLQNLTGFMAASAASATLTMQLPIQAPVGGLGRCYITGFDFSTGSASASLASNLVLSNIITQVSGSSSLSWRFVSQTGSGLFQQIRFPAPVPNDPGNQPTFTIANINANVLLNAYYYLQ